MSCTEIYYVTQTGQVRGYVDVRNSWLGAMNVWSQMYTRYYEDRIKEHKNLWGWEPLGPSSEEDFQLVWKLFSDNRLSKSEKAVLGSTFDGVMLKRENFERFYDDILEYCVYFRAGSLIKQAKEILKLKNKKIQGVVWNQTSVNCDMYDNLKRLSKSGALWSLYEKLDSQVSLEITT